MKAAFKNSGWSGRGALAIGVGILPVLFALGCQSTAPPAVGVRAYSPGRQTPTAGAAYQGDTARARKHSRRGRADREATSGSFDYYLLNLSWSPEYCATHQNSAECGRHLGFVVHGLWPQELSGDYPEQCSDEPGPANPQQYTDMIPTVGLVEHEWSTHGTCSGLTADAYFAAMRKAYGAVSFPQNMGDGSNASIMPSQLLTQFAQANQGYPGGSFALSCGNNRLTAIEVCLGKDLRPQTCQGVRSCRATVIQVTPR